MPFSPTVENTLLTHHEHVRKKNSFHIFLNAIQYLQGIVLILIFLFLLSSCDQEEHLQSSRWKKLNLQTLDSYCDSALVSAGRDGALLNLLRAPIPLQFSGTILSSRIPEQSSDTPAVVGGSQQGDMSKSKIGYN